MIQFDDRGLQALLGNYLNAKLNPQRGKALDAFQRAIAKAQRRQRPRLALWWISAGGAMAAALSLISAVTILQHDPQQIANSAQSSAIAAQISPSPQQARQPSREQAQPPADLPPQSLVAYRTCDEGTIILGDGAPARRLRRQVIQQVRWYDAQQQAHIAIIVPHEQIVLVGLNPY